MARRPIFQHPLNQCPLNYQLMIDRHDRAMNVLRVAKAVKKGVLMLVAANLTSETHQNILIQQEGLPAELRADGLQLSDRAWWWREKGKGNEWLKFWSSRALTQTCLMADTRATGYEQKRVKYTALANAIKEFR
jgi:hypothetical protein